MFSTRTSSRPNIWWVISILSVLALVIGACGGDSAATTMGDMDMDHEFAFGEPGDPADADRIVEIDATNDLVFEPSSITVSVGETITFRVTNTGSLVHDFFLGDEEMQAEHEAEMTEMRESGQMMEHDEPNAMNVGAEETTDLTWHFTEAGSVLFGCHQTGHYEQGMYGTITIQP